MSKEGTICYFDIKLGDEDLERIIMKLHDDIVPRTCANFRALCTGEQKTDELNLHFLNSIFHRGQSIYLIKNFEISINEIF
jgi:cyclophilin family peptidyl-prolyl cis-trans isomerase